MLEQRRSEDGSFAELDCVSDVDVGTPKSPVLTTIVVAVIALAAAALTLSALLLSKATNATLQVHYLLSAVVIALANNVDNLGARLAYSVQGTMVGVTINVWISVITFLISTLAAYSGEAIVASIGKDSASMLAMGMLVTLGLWMILYARVQSWQERIFEKNTSTRHVAILTKPCHADIDNSKHIDFVEGTILGIALSVNNIGGGVSAGVLGVNPLLVGFLSALISFVALFSGNYVAEFFIKRRLSDKAAFVGGVALILIGLKQVF